MLGIDFVKVQPINNKGYIYLNQNKGRQMLAWKREGGWCMKLNLQNLILKSYGISKVRLRLSNIKLRYRAIGFAGSKVVMSVDLDN